MLYVTRDVGKDTADRVAWTEGVNLPVDDGPTCGKLMRRTVNDAAALKAAAGVATTGRKLRKQFEHLTLSWSPDERPTRREMRAAALEALEARGYRGCQAFIACHTDRDHPHVHIVICRVDPKTGRARKPTHARKLQRWAEAYEERTGGIRIPNRRDRRLVREHNAREIRAAVKENRTPALRRMPAMETKRSRDPRGRAIRHRTPPERREWYAVLTERDRDSAPPAQGRAKRVEIARRQVAARLAAGTRRAAGFEQLAAAADVPPLHPPERPRDDLAHAPIEAQAPEPPTLHPPERPRDDLAHAPIVETHVPEPPVIAVPDRHVPPAPRPEDEQIAAVEAARREKAERLQRQFYEAGEHAHADTYETAAKIAKRQPGLPWRDVEAKLLGWRKTDPRYAQTIDIGHDIALDVGALRADLEDDILEHAKERSPRRVPPAKSIQHAADLLVTRTLDQVLPKQVRDPAPAAAQESATPAAREDLVAPPPQQPKQPTGPPAEPEPEATPDRGAGEGPGGARRPSEGPPLAPTPKW